MTTFFKKHRILLTFIFLGFLVFLSYAQALNFALWQDDNALIFKLQHLDQQAGVFGAGPFGLGAYRYIAVPYIPLFRIFGLNTTVFYTVAIFVYFVASVVVFLFAKYITRNFLLALCAGAIFASGFIGSDGILRLFNSIQTSYSVILVLGLLFFLFEFSRTKKPPFYFLAVGLFFLTTEFSYIRTQYIIFPVLLFPVLFLIKKFNLKSVFSFLLFSSPFIFVYWWQYLRSPDPRAHLVGDYVKSLLLLKLEYTHSFFASIGNLLFPQQVLDVFVSFTKIVTLNFASQFLILRLCILFLSFIFVFLLLRRSDFYIKLFSFLLLFLWFIAQSVVYSGSELLGHVPPYNLERNLTLNFLGGSFLFLVLSIFLKLLKSKRSAASLILFLVLWMSSNILVYSIYLPFQPLDSQNRYLIHSFASFAILFPFVVYHLIPASLKNKRSLITVVCTLVVVITNVSLARSYQANFIEEKSIPTNKFYNNLKNFLPTIEKNSLIYFDVAENPVAQQQFRDFFSVGSMPDSTAIAIRYNIDRYDFKMPQNYSEFTNLSKNTPTEKIYSFFYDTNGLVDTTKIFKKRSAEKQVYFLKPGAENLQLDLPLVTPLLVELTAKAELVPNLVKKDCSAAISDQTRNLYYGYLTSRSDYYKNSSVTTTSSEKLYPSTALLDNKTETVWRGNRGWWLENSKEIINIDLGKTKTFSQVGWINSYYNSSPIVYSIEVSDDNKNWRLVKNIETGPKNNGTIVTDDFPSTTARALRMVITQTFDKDSPAISEVEIIESPFEKVDKESALKLENNPFLCVQGKTDFEGAKNFVYKNGAKINLSWKSNTYTDWAQDASQPLKIIPDQKYYTLKFLIPAGGTHLEGLKILPENEYINFSIKEIKLTNLH